MKVFKELAQDAEKVGMSEHLVYSDNLPVFDYKSKGNTIYLITNPEITVDAITFNELKNYIVSMKIPFSLVELKTEDEEVEWEAEYYQESKVINIKFTPF